MNVRAIFLFAGVLIFLAGGAFGADKGQQTVPRVNYMARSGEIQLLRERLSTSNPRLFEANEYQGKNGKTIPYRLFKPSVQNAESKFPLILVLHGSSSRGTDNISQIASENVAVSTGIWTIPEYQKTNPCFVLAPQCPPEPDTWSRIESWDAETHSHSAKPTPVLVTILDLLDEIVEKHPVDPNRVYVIGASLSGFGTWDILSQSTVLCCCCAGVWCACRGTSKANCTCTSLDIPRTIRCSGSRQCLTPGI